MTSGGGANSSGIIFSINPDDDTFEKVHDFKGGVEDNVTLPAGSLVFAEDKLWGAAYGNLGAIFTIDPDDDTFEKVHEFDLVNGASPRGSLVFAEDKLWGVTSGGGANLPAGSLVLAEDKLWGATSEGGENDSGIIFNINTDGSDFNKVHDFERFPFINGANPRGSLVLAEDKLWGMTLFGGVSIFNGIIFSINPDDGTFEKVHEFEDPFSEEGAPNGASPAGSLVFAEDKLWGVTSGGGANEAGIIFSINPDDDTFEKVHDFQGFTEDNGTFPAGSLVFAEDKLWGVTSEGGANDEGIIFSIDPDDNSFTKVHDFESDVENNSSSPQGNLLFAEDKLWGVTSEGGSNGLGVIFSYDDTAEEAEKFQVIRSLTGEIGANPISSLIVVNTAPSVTPSENNAPTVANAIDDRMEKTDFDLITIDLEESGSPVFADADSDDLTYTATSGNSALVTATVPVNDNILTIMYGSGTGNSTITVTAMDSRGGTATDMFTVTVSVNMPPSFAAGGTTAVTLDEDAVPNTTVVKTLTAEDPDGENTNITYDITSGNNAGDFAIADATMGVVTVAKALDFETDPNSYVLEVTATDEDEGTATVSFSVTVNDVNEAPVFDAVDTTPTVAADAVRNTMVVTVRAVDEDAGDGVPTYAISAGNPGSPAANGFKISAGGVISVENNDLLTPGTITLTVTATDGRSKVGMIMFDVMITEASTPANNKPSFTSGGTSGLDIDEDATGDVRRFTANANDAEQAVIYSLRGTNSDDFSIDAMSGQITVGDGGLDFETT
ncbi:MAG: cadherin domain-containing protein, partial [Ekhidna sp.]|nr:cadherin domain-containing protein [Ekhidna sp.]